MNRRETLAALAAMGTAPTIVVAQPARKIPRVGVLFLASQASTNTAFEIFRASLRDLGYVEGRTIEFEFRSAEGRVERLPELAVQLVARNVDVILAGGGNISAFAARKATATIPIVMSGSFNAVEVGLVASLARPGGNVTGLTVPSDLGVKQLELLRELVPSLSRVAVLLRPDPTATARRAQGKAMVQEFLRLTIEYIEVAEPEDLPKAFAAIRALRPGAIMVGPDALFFQQMDQIVEFARTARLPAMYPLRDFVDGGGMLSYSLSSKEAYKTTARYIDRILRGAKPAELPVEEPRAYELVINLSVVKASGVTIPQSLLTRADELIQ